MDKTDLEKYQTDAGGLLKDSTVESLEKKSPIEVTFALISADIGTKRLFKRGGIYR